MFLTSWLSGFPTMARRPARRVRRPSHLKNAEALETRVCPAVTLDPLAAGATIDSTEEAAVTVSGTSTGSTVTIVASDTNIETPDVEVTVDVVSGAFSADLDLRGLADGALTITATDNLGGVDTDVSATLDTDTPAVFFETDADGDFAISAAEILAAGEVVTVSGVATAGDTVSVSLVDSEGNVFASAPVTADALGNFTVTFDLDDALSTDLLAADGPLTALATASNGVTVVGTAQVELDTSVELTVDIPDVDISAEELADLTISGTTDPNADVEVGLDVDQDGIADFTVTTTADADGNFEVTTADFVAAGLDLDDVVSGSVDLIFNATDELGNVSETVTETLNIDVDATLPTVTIAGGDNELIVADLGAGGELTVTGTAEPDSTVDLTLIGPDGFVLTQTVTADASGNYTATFDLDADDDGTLDVTDGLLTVVAVATDVAGNVSTAVSDIADLQIDVDIATPSVVIEAGDNDIVAGDLGAGGELEVAGTAEAGSSVQLTLLGPNGFILTQTVTAAADGTYTATFDLDANDDGTLDVAGGTISVIAQATDAAGNVSLPAVDTAVLNVGIDVTPPAVPSVSIEGGDNDIVAGDLGAGGELEVSGTAEANSQVNLTLTGPNGFTLTESVTADSNGNYSATFDLDANNDGTLDVEAGLITVVATATDAAGNVSLPGSDTATLNVGVDITPPAAPIVDVVDGDNVLDLVDLDNLVITGDAEPGSTVSITIDDGPGGQAPVTVTGVADSNGQYSIALPSLAAFGPGALTLTATATDAAGNVSTVTSVNLIVQGVEPQGGGDVEVRISRGGTLRIRPVDRRGTEPIAFQIIQDGTTLTFIGLNGTTINGQSQITVSGVEKIRGRLGRGNDDVTFAAASTQTAGLDLSLNGSRGSNTFTNIDGVFSRLRLRNFNFVDASAELDLDDIFTVLT